MGGPDSFPFHFKEWNPLFPGRRKGPVIFLRQLGRKNQFAHIMQHTGQEGMIGNQVIDLFESGDALGVFPDFHAMLP
ncbi:MAG: hypothetical protein BWY71_00658 [Planctomycetes bacterium ADurb.Bin412]|nr:MAG: hypothetical protein BWY71_00658 [Planctomycetes bacterium ADurb.Bin412]